MIREDKQVFFISTLKGSLWGGSEELWYLTAVEFLNQDFFVNILIYDFGYLNEKLLHLKSLGAIIHKRPRKKAFIIRVLSKFSYFRYLFNPYRILKAKNPKYILVTDGATYYTSDDIDLSFMLTSFFTGKYSIICQGNNQYHRPQNRDKAIELFQNAQRVFFVSERNRQECFHQLATKFENTSIIQNPINIPENINYKIPKNKDEIHIAIVGRLNISDKGQDTVIKMLDDDFWKKSNYKFHIYGDGIDKEYLEDLINFYNVSKLINIEGSSDLQTIWNKCHILLMPSLIEGTSLTMLEALLIGRVCIISNVGGASEWIKDGQNGFLIDFPTPASIEKKLKDVLEGQDCWIEICKNARASTLEKIDNNPGKTLFERLTVL